MGRRFYAKLFSILLLISLLSVVTIGCGGKGVYFVGHEGMRVFHRPGCDYAPPKDASVIFMSTKKAHEAGFRACSICDPLGKAGKE